MKTLWINAGEISGDLQGGAVLRELQHIMPEKELKVVGMGGDALAVAGQENFFRIEQLSVMGISEVLGNLSRIFRLLGEIKRKMTETKPNAVLLIDAPDFNFRIAKIAYSLGIPVYYFIPPKIWAWRTGRIKFLKKYVRRIFSILPFEKDFYSEHGMDITYVGNPLVDIVNYPSIKDIQPVHHRIGLMPGSRKKEVESLLPSFSAAAAQLLQKYSDLQFYCVRSPNFSEQYLRSFWNCPAPLIMKEHSERCSFFRSCEFILAASGTATLETGLAGVPTIVAYKVAPLSYWVGTHFLSVKWISLTNLIMHDEVFPEHIQNNANPDILATRMDTWLSQPNQLEEIKTKLSVLREKCGSMGSAMQTAMALANELKKEN